MDGNSFGTFLETKDRLRGKQPAVAEASESAPAQASEAAPAGSATDAESALVAMKLLLSSEFPITVSELLPASSLPISDFTRALEYLEDAHFVELQSDASNQERVLLTDSGQRLKAK